MKVLVVHCHPVPDSYGAACRDAALDALDVGGHDVRLLDLYAMDFRPELSVAEWEGHADGWREPDIEAHIEALRWAEALVLIHPTWWGLQPAMLRGWFDRVIAPGLAFDILPSGRLRGRLRNIRRTVMITTHGSPWKINALQGQSGRRLVGRGLRVLFHPMARTRSLALYGLDTADQNVRAEFLDRIGQQLARPRL